MDAAGLPSDPEAQRAQFNRIAVEMLYVGVACFVGAWMAEAGFKTSGMRQGAAWRKLYLTSIIRQDVGWYDTNNPSELSSRIAESTQALEEGISSKVSIGIRYGSQVAHIDNAQT